MAISIRAEQVNAFRPGLVAEANRELARYLSRRFKDLYPDPAAPATIERAAAARERARGLGLVRENDVATCLDFSVMYGDDWPGQPWAVDVIDCQRLHGPDKMTLLRARVEDSGVDLGSGGPQQ